jgi:hypothetical protein
MLIGMTRIASQTRRVEMWAEFDPRRTSRKNVIVHIHAMILSSNEPSAFHGAAFTGLYGALPAYTSKTLSALS